MFKSMHIKTQLYLNAAIAISAMLIFAVVSVYSIRAGSAALESVYENQIVPTPLLIEMEGTIKDLRFRMSNFAIGQMSAVGNKIHLNEVKARIAAAWAGYRESTSNGLSNDEQRALIAQINAQMILFTPFLEKLDKAYELDSKAKVNTLLEDEWPRFHVEMLKPVSKLLGVQQQLAKSTYDRYVALGQKFLVFGAPTLAALAALIIAFSLRLITAVTRPLDEVVAIAGRIASGDLTGKITVTSHNEMGKVLHALQDMNTSLLRLVDGMRQGADSIAKASREISSGNGELTQRTQEEASFLEETAASMEELTSTVKQNADNAKQASKMAIENRDVAGDGVTVIHKVVNTMSSINDGSKKIADIISVINEIAFQTNILALNAAVEAARAGEQGKGFSVVATEVRNLAQRSAGAAKEIEELIKNSVAQVTEGSRLVKQAGETMEKIVQSAEHVANIIEEISAASGEQSGGIEQVSHSVAQMDQITQKNAAMVEEIAGSAKSLEEQAHSFYESIKVFKLGHAAASPAHANVASSAVAAPRAPAREVKAKAANIHVLRARKADVPQKAAGLANDWTEF